MLQYGDKLIDNCLWSVLDSLLGKRHLQRGATHCQPAQCAAPLEIPLFAWEMHAILDPLALVNKLVPSAFEQHS